MLGSGFGRRTRSDYVTEAVLIAKQMPGTPIKLLKSREEDMTNGVYHPVTAVQADRRARQATTTSSACTMRISGQSILSYARPEAMQDGADPAVFQGLNPGGAEGAFGYDIPNLLVDHAMRNPHVPPGFWRGVNNNQNAIYLECFIDELAQAAGQDPLAFRRKMMAKHPKHLGRAQCRGREASAGTSRRHRASSAASASTMGYGSYVAAAAEVSVSQDNKVKMHRIVAATESRTRRQPGADRAADRRLVRLRPVRRCSTAASPSRTAPSSSRPISTPTTRCAWPRCRRWNRSSCRASDFWGGVGEPTIFVAAPAVLNAIFAATGQRYPLVPAEEPELSSLRVTAVRIAPRP